MDYSHFYTDRVKRVKSSSIREILAVTQRSDVISFAGGLPNPETFPTQAIGQACTRVLEENPHLALQYCPTDGIPELREEVATYLNKDGTTYDADQVVVTNGSQQALDLIGRVFLQRGNKVIVGSPTYLGMIQAFEHYLNRGEDFVPVESDEDGMDPQSVDETLGRLKAAGHRAKLIYTCPTFQNPAGTVMSASRRRKLIDVAHEHDVMIIEDDPYGKLRFEGEELPKISSLDKEGRVLYLGTFSKVFVPGFRLAWMAGPEPIMRQVEVAKQPADLCSAAFTQFVTADLMRGGVLEKHLPSIISLYRRKRDILMRAMDQRMPEGITWTRSQGGLFTWAKLPQGIDTTPMLKQAIANKVAYVPGNSFFVDESGPNTMRINFSHPADDMLPVGVDRLASTIEAEMRRTKTLVA